MSVAIASTDQLSSTTDTSFNVSVNRSSGEALLIGISTDYDFGTPRTVSGVTWDAAGANESFSLVNDIAVDINQNLAVFALSNPTGTGSKNVTIALSGGGGHSRAGVLVRHITGHDTTGMVRAAVENSGSLDNNSSFSHDISSAIGDLCVDFLFHRDDASLIDPNGGQGDDSEFAPDGVTSRTLASSSEAGATTVGMGWAKASGGGAFGYGHIIASIKPAAGGGAPANQYPGVLSQRNRRHTGRYL